MRGVGSEVAATGLRSAAEAAATCNRAGCGEAERRNDPRRNIEKIINLNHSINGCVVKAEAMTHTYYNDML